MIDQNKHNFLILNSSWQWPAKIKRAIPFSEILPHLVHKRRLIVMVNNRFTFFTKAHTNQYTTVLSLKFPLMLTGKTGKLHILLTRKSSNSLLGRMKVLGSPILVPRAAILLASATDRELWKAPTEGLVLIGWWHTKESNRKWYDRKHGWWQWHTNKALLEP